MITVWKDVPVRIHHKVYHVRKIGKRGRHAFTNDFGDVPVCNYNPDTKVWEDVDNPRGIAYAARRRLKYRPSRKELRQNANSL